MTYFSKITYELTILNNHDIQFIPILSKTKYIYLSLAK